MTAQNEEVKKTHHLLTKKNDRMMSIQFQAEELMRKIEREEDKLPFESPEKKVFHLCIVNLVIG